MANPFGFEIGVPDGMTPRKPAQVMRRAKQDLPSVPFGFSPPPSKLQQTWDYLRDESGIGAPIRGAYRLMNTPLEVLLGAGSQQQQDQAVANSWDAAGGMAMTGSVVPKPDNALNMGIRLFHGSPHDFPPVRLIEMADGTRLYQNMRELPNTPEGAKIIQEFPLGRFDMSKIGTGEGAQAYGHGLYFAEAEDVAKGYRDRLTIDQTNSPIAAGRGYESDPDAQRILAEVKRLGLPANSLDALIKETGERAQRLAGAGFQNDAKTLGDLQYDLIEHADKFAPAGSMYEVNINADPNAFLDWDKPLSEQGAIDRFSSLPEFARPLDELEAENVTGQRLHQRLANKLGEDGASKTLREAGIPGIKYLDAGSRSAGDGTRNYVVFDDKLISIVRKYGIAGASAMLGYNILDGMDPAQADELKRIEGNQ